MAEHIIWSVSNMKRTDWLCIRAVSFKYRVASFDGKISEFILSQINQIPVRFTKDYEEQAATLRNKKER